MLSPVLNQGNDDGDNEADDDDDDDDNVDVDDNGGDDNYSEGVDDADISQGFVTADDIIDNENSMVSLPFSNGAVPSPGSNPLPPTTGSPVNSGPGSAPTSSPSPSLSPVSMSVLKPLSSLRLDVQGAVRVLVEFSLRKVCVITWGQGVVTQ